MKAGAQLQQRGDLPVQLYRAAARLQGAHQQFQQSRFTGAIVADDSEALAVRQSKGNVRQHVVELMARFAQDDLPQSVLRTVVDFKVLVQVADGDARRVHLQHISEGVPDAHEQPAADAVADQRGGHDDRQMSQADFAEQHDLPVQVDEAVHGVQQKQVPDTLIPDHRDGVNHRREKKPDGDAEQYDLLQIP